MNMKARATCKKKNLIKNLMFIVGHCFGLSFHETHSTCPYHGEALPNCRELWIHSAILHPDAGWSHNIVRYPGENGPRESTSSGIQAQRQWSLPFLFKATVTQQDSAWDSAACIVQDISMLLHFALVFPFQGWITSSWQVFYSTEVWETK